jgi:dienelactone hydrolase
MANVLMFHHALGLTRGVRAFAERLREAGHAVVTPDLYDGAVYDAIADGVAHAKRVGFETIIARGVACADALGERSFVAGFSLGALPAQKLAQTRSGVAGAILYHAGDVPASTFSARWPAGVRLQLHLTERDEWIDLDVARKLAMDAGGEVFVYPGSAHLVTDSSFSEYDPEIAARILERTLAFLGAR